MLKLLDQSAADFLDEEKSGERVIIPENLRLQKLYDEAAVMVEALDKPHSATVPPTNAQDLLMATLDPSNSPWKGIKELLVRGNYYEESLQALQSLQEHLRRMLVAYSFSPEKEPIFVRQSKIEEVIQEVKRESRIEITTFSDFMPSKTAFDLMRTIDGSTKENKKLLEQLSTEFLPFKTAFEKFKKTLAKDILADPDRDSDQVRQLLPFINEEGFCMSLAIGKVNGTPTLTLFGLLDRIQQFQDSLRPIDFNELPEPVKPQRPSLWGTPLDKFFFPSGGEVKFGQFLNREVLFFRTHTRAGTFDVENHSLVGMGRFVIAKGNRIIHERDHTISCSTLEEKFCNRCEVSRFSVSQPEIFYMGSMNDWFYAEGQGVIVKIGPDYYVVKNTLGA
jgi:hypothetical protein